MNCFVSRLWDCGKSIVLLLNVLRVRRNQQDSVVNKLTSRLNRNDLGKEH